MDIIAKYDSYQKAFLGSSSLNNQNNNNSILKNKEKDQKEIDRLKKRDLEVRTHERAHMMAGGGSPHYEFETGPDGKRYAVGGHVDIELSEGSTPEETIRKADKVIRAALAPQNPSTQDKKVASEANQMKIKARQEIAENKRRNQEGLYNNSGTKIDNAERGFLLNILA